MRELKMVSSHNAVVTTTDPVAGGEMDLGDKIHVGGRELSAILLLTAATTDTTTDITAIANMQESATTVSSDYTDISGATFTASNSTDFPIAQQIYFQATKRFVRTRFNPDGTPGGIGVASVILAISKSTT